MWVRLLYSIARRRFSRHGSINISYRGARAAERKDCGWRQCHRNIWSGGGGGTEDKDDICERLKIFTLASGARSTILILAIIAVSIIAVYTRTR